MDAKTAYRTILSETRKVLAQLPHLAEFADLPAEELPFLLPEARPLPVCQEIPAIADLSVGWIRPLADAVARAVPHLRMEQTYQRSEVGGDYLRQYGWFNLVSPHGPFVSHETRIAISVWGQGLVYPEHFHEPEEIYVVIAGGGVLQLPDCPPVRLRPGHTAEVASNQTHAFDMTDSPLMAMVVWKGQGLSDRATLAGSATA